MKTYKYFILSAFISIQAVAKENVNQKLRNPVISKIAANCPATTAQYDLDINNVRAKVLNGGDLWWDPVGQSAMYEVPVGSGKHSLFAGAIWIAGLDNAQQIRAAAQTYRQSGNDFWSGPISSLASVLDISNSTCSQYDRFWTLTKTEVQNFVNGGSASADIMSWPGNGNVAGGELPMLAPFFDADNDGIYNYLNGDYPYFVLSGTTPPASCNGFLKGDKSVWWVFNDIGNVHTETLSPDPIGLEIHAQAFGFSNPDPAINNATFYEYQVINRSNSDLNDTYFGVWSDPDLGNAADDYVGCDVGLGLGYCFNGDPDDDGPAGYGLNPPAIGVDFFQGPIADAGDGIDNDRDGSIDEFGEQIIMSNFQYYENLNSSPIGNPAALDDYYQYLSSFWLDGQHVTYGVNGRTFGNPDCNYMFPGTSDPAFPGQPWTMATAGMPVADMRFIMSAGAFTLSPGEVNYITTGAVWARAATGGPMASLQLLHDADSTIQTLFDNCFVVGINQHHAAGTISMYPSPCITTSVMAFENNNGTPYIMYVYNASGKLLKEIRETQKGRIEFNRSGLESGVYIYSLKSGNKLVHSGKIPVL